MLREEPVAVRLLPCENRLGLFIQRYADNAALAAAQAFLRIVFQEAVHDVVFREPLQVAVATPHEALEHEFVPMVYQLLRPAREVGVINGIPFFKGQIVGRAIYQHPVVEAPVALVGHIAAFTHQFSTKVKRAMSAVRVFGEISFMLQARTLNGS